jgi:AcrR family transcriptional regulator
LISTAMSSQAIAATEDSNRPKTSKARARILDAAYELFTMRGLHAVGVDAIIAKAGVAKMTFYRHFRSKEGLALAVLERRETLWTHEWFEAEVKSRAAEPTERLLAIFDIFDEWFQRPDFEGCFFVNTLLEMPERGDPIREASNRQIANVRVILTDLAAQAGVSKPDDFAHKWQIVLKGSIIAAAEGDRLAASRARDLCRLLLESELRKPD